MYPKPIGKLSANSKLLYCIPRSNKKYHVVPISDSEWNPISFYAFLKTIDPQIFQTSFKRGRKGNYNGYGECHTCKLQLYRILINISKLKIKFVLYNACEHLPLARTECDGRI